MASGTLTTESLWNRHKLFPLSAALVFCIILCFLVNTVVGVWEKKGLHQFNWDSGAEQQHVIWARSLLHLKLIGWAVGLHRHSPRGVWSKILIMQSELPEETEVYKQTFQCWINVCWKSKSTCRLMLFFGENYWLYLIVFLLESLTYNTWTFVTGAVWSADLA